MKNVFKRFIAPIRTVVKKEKIYLVWLIFVLIFGIINIWGAFLVGNNETVISSLQEGGLIVAAISICAPFIAEIFSEILVDKKNNEKSKFLSYKILSGLVNVLWVIVLCFLWIGIYKDKVILQIILYVISLIISFYMYCVGKMEKHMDVTAEYDDSDYLVKENNSVLTLSDESSNAQSFEVKGKGEIKL